MLAPEMAARAILPKEYVLEITNPETANTFVFSEKDLPGYPSKLRDSMKLNGGSAAPLAQRPAYHSHLKNGPQGFDRLRKGQGRRGIPSEFFNLFACYRY